MTEESQHVPEPAPQAPSVRKTGVPWLVLFVLLLGAVGAGYWWWTREVTTTTLAPTAPAQLTVAQQSDLDSLRARLEDAAQVNRALRQQVLGLTQRLGVIEENLNSLERGSAPGLDTQRLVEADFLLRLAEQRLALFGDIAGARAALQLADGQLKDSTDVRTATVRQTLQLEIDMLTGIATADLPPLLARLQALADAALSWPLAGNVGAVPADSANDAWHTRAVATLDRYFRVRRLADSEASDLWVRDRLALDLSAARWLLLRGEGASAKSLLGAVRETMATRLDQRDEGVKQALASIDTILSAPLAPEVPALGEARRELARLLRINTAAAPVPDLSEPAVDAAPVDGSPASPVEALPGAQAAPDAAGQPQPEAPSPVSEPDQTDGSSGPT